jgi:hypothetical protein
MVPIMVLLVVGCLQQAITKRTGSPYVPFVNENKARRFMGAV